MSVNIESRTFDKDPNDVLDFTINYISKDETTNDGGATDDGWLQGDTISTSTWTGASGVTVDSDSNTTTTTTVWLSAGAVGTDGVITNRIVTAGGRTKDVTLYFKLVER